MVAPLVMGGLSLASSLFGGRKQAKAQKELMNYQRSLRLDPVTGQFGQIGVNDGNVSLGSFGDLQDAFSGGAGEVLGGLNFSGSMPPEIAEALGMFQSRLQPNVNPMLGGLRRGMGQAGGVAGQAFGELLGGNDPQAGLMAQLFSGASGLAGQVGGNFDDVRAGTLANLRSQAMPENQRAVDSTLSRLFAQGRLGSTGGANILGRLSEAQNQQDLGFQLAAGDEARAASADVTGRFGTLLSGGQGLQSAAQSRLQDAFSRFTGATGLGADLSSEAFARTSGLEQEGFDRLLANLGATTAASGVGLDRATQGVGLAQGLLGGATSIQDMLNQAFTNSLNLANAKTNVRVAGAGLNTSSMNAPGYSASPTADALQSLFGGMVKPGAMGDAFGSLLSKIRARRQPFDRFQTA